MPQVNPLDSVTEQRLLQALSAVSDRIAGGDDPNTAICKIAGDRQFTPDQTELIIRAYNTARSQYQFSSGDSLSDKLASFPSADPDQILPKLFEGNCKTAAQERHAVAVASDYALPPSYWLNKVAREERAEANAKIIADARREHKLGAAPGRIDHSIDQQHSRFLQARRTGDDARQALSQAKYAANAALFDLVGYFAGPNAVSFHAVKSNAKLSLGKTAELLLDAVAEMQPHLAKLAKTTPVSHYVNWQVAPYSLIQECLDKSAAFVDAHEAADAMEKQAKEVQDEFQGPFGEAVRPTTITGSVWADQSPEPTKEAMFGAAPAVNAGIGAAVSGGMRSFAEGITGNRESQIRSHLSNLENPAHEQELRQIRTQTMLADMMQHDPVISGYPQDSVLDAYSRLSEVAPNAVQHRLISQSLLRKYLSQGDNLADFDVDQLLGVESKLRPTSQPQAAPAPK